MSRLSKPILPLKCSLCPNSSGSDKLRLIFLARRQGFCHHIHFSSVDWQAQLRLHFQRINTCLAGRLLHAVGPFRHLALWRCPGTFQLPKSARSGPLDGAGRYPRTIKRDHHTLWPNGAKFASVILPATFAYPPPPTLSIALFTVLPPRRPKK